MPVFPRFVRVALCVFVLITLVLPAWADETVRAHYVFDGDTLALADGRRVRLTMIDAPELAHDGRPAQRFAAEARAALSKLALGHELTLTDALPDPDRHGRVLARLRLPDGRDLGEALVAAGLATAYPHPDSDPARLETLLALQRAAMDCGAGLWALYLELPREPQVGNARSRRFGPPGCAVVRRIAPRNRRAFASIPDAFRAGFAPYRECPPLP